MYLVTVALGNDIDNSKIDAEKVKNFIMQYVIPAHRKNILERIMTYLTPENTVPANILNNLIINFEALKPANTKYFRQFLIDNGVDYNIIENPFGWGERMMVLFNMRKIVNIQRVNPKDKVETYDLKEHKSSAPINKL